MISVLPASVLPIAIYLVTLKLLDSFALVRMRRIAICIAAGTISCLAVWMLCRGTGIIWISGISVVPLMEEFAKGCIIIYLTSGRKIKFLSEALIYGAAVGGGFALLENIIYVLSNPDMDSSTALFRGFGCAFLHIGCTGLAACLLYLFSSRKPFAAFVLPAFLPSALLHLAHNNLPLPAPVLLSVTILVFAVIFLAMFVLDGKRIYRWMDHSLSIDVQTLSSIRQGNFATTKAGEYLLGMKEQFQPEVFFDIITYEELYLELKIEKQSRMLLSQAGFSPDSKDDEAFRQKVSELSTLKKQIGRTGFRILSPLVQDGGNLF